MLGAKGIGSAGLHECTFVLLCVIAVVPARGSPPCKAVWSPERGVCGVRPWGRGA